jgi:beta-galactosidase
MDAINEAIVDTSDSRWKEAFKDRDYNKLAEAYVYRGTFMLPEDFSSSQITLFHKNIGAEQSIFINKKKIAANLKESEISKGFTLDKSILKPGKNVISIMGTPIPKKNEWDVPNRDPGLIQMITPPGSWKRELFNGLSQVIIQTKKEAGEITLTATSPGLKAGIIRLKARPVNIRPCLE